MLCVSLSRVNIGLEGARLIAQALKVNHSITSIRLWESGITDEGVEHIAVGLVRNTSLKELT